MHRRCAGHCARSNARDLPEPGCEILPPSYRIGEEGCGLSIGSKVEEIGKSTVTYNDGSGSKEIEGDLVWWQLVAGPMLLI